MLKILKYLKKYIKVIPFIFLLIAISAIATLRLPDYMSKIISEGIKSPAYETNENGDNIKSILSPYTPMVQMMLQDENFKTYFGVKKYNRITNSKLYTDTNGYAVLADQNGNPVIDEDTGLALTDQSGNIKANILYEKDEQGNLIKDSQTNSYIVKYARIDNQGNFINNSYIITDENNETSTSLIEKDDSQNIIIAPAVMDVFIYAFDKEPSDLKLDDYGNATFIGFYTNDEQIPYTINFGQSSIPVFKFERIDQNVGSLLINDDGSASLKQVSYMPIIIKYGLIMLGITFLISLCGIIANYLSSNVSMKLGRDLRSKLYKKVNNLSMLDSGKIGTSSLITRTTNDVVQVQTVMFMIFRMVVMPPIMFIGGLIMALNKDAQMTLVLLVSIPVILLLILFVGKKVIPLFKSMQKKIDNMTLVARENLTGVRVIRAFNREKTEDERFEKANADVTNTAIKANRVMSVMFPAVMLLMNLTTLAIVAIAVITSKNNILNTTYTDFANMMAVTQYILQIMMSLLFVMMMFVLFPRASASAVRINEVLEMTPSINNPDNPQKNQSDKKGEIVFDNVSFKFEGSDAPILSDINFKIEKGKTISIIGSTGSGKSTLVNMISRIVDATEGTVYLNGIDVKKYDQNDLRKKISFVPQKSLLFTGTIAENLKFGDENADEQKMLKILDTSQAKDFVLKKAEGLNAIVDHGGVNFSGGQKQRLSIARALIKEAEIYIFDDSFSALDFKTDFNLRKALKKDLKDKTVIIVSQRIGTVMNSDNIIVLDDGKIAGQGKHKELLKSCKIYKEIALSQLSEEELKNE